MQYTSQDADYNDTMEFVLWVTVEFFMPICN